jgi:hypothetical protein
MEPGNPQTASDFVKESKAGVKETAGWFQSLVGFCVV